MITRGLGGIFDIINITMIIMSSFCIYETTWCTYIHAGIQTKRGGEKGRQTDRRTGEQADRDRDRLADRGVGDGRREKGREGGRERGKEEGGN